MDGRGPRTQTNMRSSLFHLLGRNLRRRVDRLGLQGKNAAAVAVSRRLKAVAEAAINLNANYVRLALLVIRVYDPMGYDFVNEAEILCILGRQELISFEVLFDYLNRLTGMLNV